MQFNETEYSALLEKIFSITPSVQKVGFEGGAYKPGLSGMKEFDARLGHPSRHYPTIHVAGTNGKGSVSSMLASALAAEGKRVGLYTSPHLVDFRERLKIVSAQGYIEPSKEEVWEFFNEFSVDGLSFFEITTGLALLWFARQKVDCAVIEVGLGGRLDSTNIITPSLSIITSIGLDHCALLGDTRALIAGEKAGIFKSGVPAIVASKDRETENIFAQAATAVSCPLYFADSAPTFGEEATIRSKMDLQGPCQDINLHTVLFALNLLGINYLKPSVRKAIENTAARTGFRGRWERLSVKQQDGAEVICDIAHNSAALAINFKRLQTLGKPLCIVYGIMADKDLDSIAPLMPNGAQYILVAPNIPRAMKVDTLYQRLSALRSDLTFSCEESVALGIEAALAKSTPDTLIYIGGSSFVVSEALEYFNTLKR